MHISSLFFFFFTRARARAPRARSLARPRPSATAAHKSVWNEELVEQRTNQPPVALAVPNPVEEGEVRLQYGVEMIFLGARTDARTTE